MLYSGRWLDGFGLIVTLWLGVAASPAQSVADGALDRVFDVGPAILACWRPPQGSEGMEVTLVFSFRRSGEILGKPRISHAKLQGDQNLQKRFVASVLQALAACTPLRITPALGGAIAGRPFAMLFKAALAGQKI